MSGLFDSPHLHRVKRERRSQRVIRHHGGLYFGVMLFLLQGSLAYHTIVSRAAFPTLSWMLSSLVAATAAATPTERPASSDPGRSRPVVDDTDGSSTHANEAAFLLLCLTDGRIYSLQAWTGEYQSVIHTNPLLQSNYFDNHEHDDMILPGLDGRLYWRPPVRHDDTGTSVAERDAHQKPHRPLLPPLEELPLTVTDLLENPVRRCDPECNILTAQAVTSLLALSATGQLLWQSSDTSRNGQSEQDKQTNSPLLLQRKDYWVNNVHATTGHPSWNVSLGTYQALDFELNQPSDDEEYLLDNDDDDSNNHPRSSRSDPLTVLPSILFTNAGKTLTAVDPGTDKVLWRQDVPSTLAAVFGIHQGQWKTVPVIPEAAAAPFDPESKAVIASPTLPVQRLELDSKSHPKSQFSEYEQLLWQSQQQLWADTMARQNPKAIGTGDVSRRRLQRKRAECRANGDLDDTCPNLKINLPLQLPSPATVPITVHAEGLLLSWSLVGVILAVLAAAVGCVRLWYLSKKNKWVAEAALVAAKANTVPELPRESRSERPFVRWDTATTLTQRVTAQPMKRSRSLPGTMAADALEAERLSPPVVRDKSDAHVFTSDTNVTRTNSTDSAMEASTPMAVDYSSLGVGIPLVRYSRYASEFEELQALGKGGFGSVYCCKNTLDRRDYAVKKVSIRCSGVDEFQQQLQLVLREVKILAVLDHPNIVRYYAAWLEIEDKQSQQRLYREGDDNTSTYGTMSRRHSFSSSQLLTTDSVSEWDTSPQNRVKQSHLRGSPKQAEGLYATSALDYPGDSSTLPRRRSLRHIHGVGSRDDLMIFEDSKEDGRDSSTEERLNHSESIAREQSTLSRRDDDSATTYTRPDDVNSATTRDVDETEKSNEAVSVTDATLIHAEKLSPITLRHTLYIQMQLCSQGTVADFLSDQEARRGSSTDAAIDIPKALRLFLQIAEATQYVHHRGLIHRDIKPSNCFMDDSCSTVKVGDFGLSRESSSDDEHNLVPEVAPQCIQRRDSQEDHTAGVGTRSYASPEQMKGSDYDSSTDVYSLGIIFFELLYPMYTGMERHICLSNLRTNTFPKDWEQAVGSAFPTVKDLLISMLSSNPTCRPTALSVARHIQSILGEFTIVSLDQQHYRNRPDTVLLRVEAAHCEDALQHTMQLIRDESSAANDLVDIVQYGMRSGTVDGQLGDEAKATPTTIMEFALRYTVASNDGGSTTLEPTLHTHRRAVSNLVCKLIQRPEIFKARQVSDPLSTSS